jgi:hypothetical protein
MFLGLLTLLTALIISGVAVFYSVSGLAAIFAGASVPIIIMGASLEVGKLVTASWLHRNWKTAPIVLKTYLAIATVVLMLITSMGIFGFLSRAHVEQGAPVGDIQAQVELIDEKISAKRQEIEQAKTALKNLDAVVEQFMSKGRDERSVTAANNARKGQQAERNKTTKSIEDAQKEISKLQEQRIPLTQQVRKIETEVGPIKYIAAFIYGSNPDQNLLEKAVTWMILIIIFVFDPLAVLLLIAGQISLIQSSEERRKKKEVPPTVETPQEPVIQQADHILEREAFLATLKADEERRMNEILERENELTRKLIEERELMLKQQTQDMFEKIEKGEITFDTHTVEEQHVADIGNDSEVHILSNDTVLAESSGSSDNTVADADKPADVDTSAEPDPELTARWQELEEQVANLKKKEQYLMKSGNQQILVTKES